MMRNMLCRIAFVVVLGMVAEGAQAVTYRVTDLAGLGASQGADFATASAISPDGMQIVGQMQFTANGFSHNHAFRYADGTATNLHSFGVKDDTFATGVNNAGQAVGWVSVWHDENSSPGYYVHPFLNTGGASAVLPHDGAELYSINASGQISGQHMVADVGVFLMLREPNGSSSLLDTPGNGIDVWNQGINDNGWVAAWGHTQSPSPFGMVSRPTESGRVVIDLGHIPGGDEVRPLDINNNGTVVGGAMVTLTYMEHAFLSVVNGEGYSTPIDLGTLSGMGNWSEARAINNNGWIVGEGSRGSLPARGFLAIDSGSGYDMLDLNDLLLQSDQSLWTVENAFDIADTGQILGVARDSGGDLHSVLLSPTPEPSTLMMLVMAGGTILGFAWRRRAR